MKITKCTITLNRRCNLRCEWCYAKNTGFKPDDDMDQETFDKIVSFIHDSNLKSVCLIGGEPTLYPNLFYCLNQLSDCKISIVTNGLLLSKKEYIEKFLKFKNVAFSVSIKADNRENYKNLTGKDEFKKVELAIKNLIKYKMNFSVSYVITEDNIDNIEKMVEYTNKLGVKNYFFSFCRLFNENKDNQFIKNNNPVIVAKKITKVIKWLKENCKHIMYSFNDPLCVLPDEFIEQNISDFKSPCYVHTQSQITFDPKGNVIPCNTIHKIQVGTIGKNFNTLSELEYFYKSDAYREVYKKLLGIPDKKCLECKLFKLCQGRCVCNWTNYSFKQLQLMIRRYKYNKPLIDCLVLERQKEIINEIDNRLFLNLKPVKFNLIVGLERYNGNANYNVGKLQQNINCYNYSNFQDIAFITDDSFVQNRVFKICMVSILTFVFGSHDFAVRLIDYFGSKNELFKIIAFLYYHEIMLVNVSELDTLLRNTNFNKNNLNFISSVLICANNINKNNCFKKWLKTNKIKTLKIMHPSKRNVNNAYYIDSYEFGIQSNDCIGPYYKNNPTASITSFHIF